MVALQMMGCLTVCAWCVVVCSDVACNVLELTLDDAERSAISHIYSVLLPIDLTDMLFLKKAIRYWK